MSEENRSTRTEVLYRIEPLPAITQDERDLQLKMHFISWCAVCFCTAVICFTIVVCTGH